MPPAASLSPAQSSANAATIAAINAGGNPFASSNSSSNTSTNTVGAGVPTSFIPTNSYVNNANSPAQNGGSISPTVVSDAPIREDTIPSAMSSFNSLTASVTTPPAVTTGNAYSTGFNTDTNTNTTGANVNTSNNDTQNGDITASPYYQDLVDYYGGDINQANALINSNPDLKSELGLLQGLGANNDATALQNVASIQKNYALKTAALAGTQAGQNKTELNTLLSDGGERYASGSSDGVMSTLDKYHVQQAQSLQDEENNLIATATEALKSGHYDTLNKMIDSINSVRDQKNAALQTVNKSITDANTTAAAAKLKASQDEAITNAYASGKTNVPDILKALNYDANGKQIGNYTADQISTTLKDISSNTGMSLGDLSGESKNFFILKQNNALPPSISSLPANQQLGAYLQYVKQSSTLPKSGSGSSSKNSVTSGGLTISKADIGSGAEQLDKTRGSDGYVNSGTYLQMYNKWVAAGGTPQDFISNYPPKIYTNPDDSSLPSYLRPTSSSSDGNYF